MYGIEVESIDCFETTLTVYFGADTDNSSGRMNPALSPLGAQIHLNKI
jgi:hypothetical protein